MPDAPPHDQVPAIPMRSLTLLKFLQFGRVGDTPTFHLSVVRADDTCESFFIDPTSIAPFARGMLAQVEVPDGTQVN